MQIQMKNPNEYREGNRLYIKKLRKCTCAKKEDEAYLLECHVIQRGTHEYTYKAGNQQIVKYGSNKALWLGPEAEKTVLEAVAAFEDFVASAECNDYRKVTHEESELSIFYRRCDQAYDYVLKYKNPRNGRKIVEICCNNSLEQLLKKLRFEVVGESGGKSVLRNPTPENAETHPMIIAAEKYGDMQLALEVKRFYHLETAEDCAMLGKLLGCRVLPPMSAEFNKEYVVDASTITSEHFNLLKRSGYEIWHRPYFAMHHSTHANWTLNPHTKHVLDAAKVDQTAITFEAFLEVFEKGWHVNSR